MPKKDDYRLCYVKDHVLYFTDDFENCWGDDFDDAPYQWNAGEPYDWVDNWSAEQNRELKHTHIRYMGYLPYACDIREADSYGEMSVENINQGAVPWLTLGWGDNDDSKLYAGATIEEAIEWLKKAGAKWGELK